MTSLILLASLAALSPPDVPQPIDITTGLSISACPRGGRGLVSVDPIYATIVSGDWKPPKEGDQLPQDGRPPATWTTVTASDTGEFHSLPPGYLFAQVESPDEKVFILEASGHSTVLVNGQPRAGDTYSHGYLKLPVLLKKGPNDLLFRVSRGRLKARLVPPRATAQLEPADSTLPDLVSGEAVSTWAALPVLNSASEGRDGLSIDSRVDGGPWTTTPLPSLLTSSARKVGFRLESPAISTEGTSHLDVRLKDRDGSVLDSCTADLRVRAPQQTRKRTFISSIDGSVQYYAHVPMKTPAESPPALVLTLHGASVEAIGQADAYAPKDWCHIVAPTNRRPYGFDWEDWGRLDALEVLDLASRELNADPNRTYLTGHSMGGHGTWHVGVTFADRFAAIAPSAGWISMRSYAGLRLPDSTGDLDPAAFLTRAANPSDTLALKSNLKNLGVYVLHGDADDNVPVDQARTMRAELGQFHPDFSYYERPGAGHWWGNECVDWPPLFEYLADHVRPTPANTPSLDFTTFNPSISSRSRWATIESQTVPLQASRIEFRQDISKRSFDGTTTNVDRLSLNVSHLEPSQPLSVTLDGTSLPVDWPNDPTRVHFSKSSGSWQLAPSPSPDLKGPHRSGPFKDAFRHRMILVYGTQGTPEENSWSLARARFDAETFGYQGNGSVDVLPDTSFDPTSDPDRSVILYGNRDTHQDWDALLPRSPITVTRDQVLIGDRETPADDLACSFLRPRPGSDLSSVAVISGTGLRGLELSDRLPLFVSGIAYPDWLLLDSTSLTSGPPGLVASGFFSNDWTLSLSQSAWRKPAAP